MQYRILGPLEVDDGERPVDLGSPKQRALLAALVIHANETVPADRLIDYLWGEDPPASAAHSVQVYVSELRKALLPDEPILTRPQGYELRIEPDAIDAVRFERLVAAASADIAAGRAEAGADGLRVALELWRGPPFTDFSYAEFAQPAIRRLEEAHLTAQEELAEADLARGNVQQVIQQLRSLIEQQPLRERPRRLLMIALYRSGRHAEALRAYQEFRTLLGEELGIEPSPELRRLEEQILLQDPDLDAPPQEDGPVPTAADEDLRNPYKGLRAFREADGADFYGRRALTDRLVAELAGDDPLIAVVGPSGSGKSSVVRAGLIPALLEGRLSGDWIIVTMVPGSTPFAELEAALLRAAPASPATLLDLLTDGDLGVMRGVLRVLPDDGSRLLLIIDQFEELFSLVDDEEVRSLFLAGLVAALRDAHSRFRLLVALRADFYDRPLFYPEFGPLLTGNVVHVLPLTPQELEKAAVAPAAAVGVDLEPAVVVELVAEVAARPGALPLFQYTLTDLFEEREGRTLTLAAYQNVGGLRGALTGRAEELHGKCDTEQQAAVQQLFLRLVTIGEADELARRRVHAGEIVSLEIDTVALQSVIDLFGHHRLLSFDRDPITGDPTVEVAHDALLREWDRLRMWIEQARGDLRQHSALAGAVADWEREGRNPDYLPTGSRLEQYEAWEPIAALRLNEHERAFLDAAVARRETEQAAEAQRIAREAALERRARVRLWGFVGVAAALVAIVAVIALVALGPEPTRVGLVFQGPESESINALVGAGMDRAVDDFGIAVNQVTSLVDIADDLSHLAESDHELVILNGSVFGEALQEAAPEFPEMAFVILDAFVDLPNVTSVQFAHEQGSFLVGAAAALESQTGTIGFLGGLPIPLIESFRAGFETGARAADPTVDIVFAWVTDDPTNFGAAFGSPGAGRLAASALFDAGADIVYHAAGPSGDGLFEEARDRTSATGRRHWGIGVDGDQYLDFDAQVRAHVLTSMVKRLDVGVYEVVDRFETGELQPGLLVLDLASEAVGYTTSGDHMAAATITALEDFGQRIASGEIVVPTEPKGIGRLVEAVPGTPISIAFDGESCAYAGPNTLGPDTSLKLTGENLAAGSAYLGAIELPPEVTWEMIQASAETWRLADGPPEDAGTELAGISLFPGSTSEARFRARTADIGIQVIYPLSPDGRFYPCKLITIAGE